jgi:hypothetical protein
MPEYHITWLIAIFCGLASALSVIGLGCYSIGKVIEDLSNSAALSAFGVRLFRMAPGGGLIVFGCVLLWKLVRAISSLTPPTHLP